MPRIPIDGGGDLEFKFIPKEGEKPSAKKPAKNWREEFEKALRFIFFSFLILLSLVIIYKKFGTEREKMSVANASQEAVTEGDPWENAFDANGDGIIEAWEGVR